MHQNFPSLSMRIEMSSFRPNISTAYKTFWSGTWNSHKQNLCMALQNFCAATYYELHGRAAAQLRGNIGDRLSMDA